MEDIWNRIESWIKINAPELYSDLLPGASEKEILTVEENINVKLPADVRLSFSIHNGQLGSAAPLIGDWQLISLEVVFKRWKVLKDLYDSGEFQGIWCKTKGSVQSKWWIPSWIPIAYNGAGDYKCIDMNPAEGGKVGQIISFWHALDKREVLVESFRDWLQDFAGDLENGRYEYKDGKLILSKHKRKTKH